MQRPVGEQEGEAGGESEDSPKKRCGDVAGSDSRGQGWNFGFPLRGEITDLPHMPGCPQWIWGAAQESLAVTPVRDDVVGAGAAEP